MFFWWFFHSLLANNQFLLCRCKWGRWSDGKRFQIGALSPFSLLWDYITCVWLLMLSVSSCWWGRFCVILSTGVNLCSWFLFGCAASIFLLVAHSRFVWTSNGKLWAVTGDFSKTHQRVEKPLSWRALPTVFLLSRLDMSWLMWSIGDFDFFNVLARLLK